MGFNSQGVRRSWQLESLTGFRLSRGRKRRRKGNDFPICEEVKKVDQAFMGGNLFMHISCAMDLGQPSSAQITGTPSEAPELPAALASRMSRGMAIGDGR